MKRILLHILVMIALAITPAAVFSASVLAACPAANDAKGQVLAGVNETGSDCSEAGVTNTFGVIVNILSIILGAVAVIMVVLAGFKYTTAGGDSGKVASAKSTLIYALVGLAVAAIAQLMVHVVIAQTSASL